MDERYYRNLIPLAVREVAEITATVDGIYLALAFHQVGDMTYKRFRCIIDEVRIYSRTLTEVEVKALYGEAGL